MEYELLNYSGDRVFKTRNAADVIWWATTDHGTVRFLDETGTAHRMNYKGIIDDFDEVYGLDCGVYYVLESGTYYLHNIYDPEYAGVF